MSAGDYRSETLWRGAIPQGHHHWHSRTGRVPAPRLLQVRGWEVLGTDRPGLVPETVGDPSLSLDLSKRSEVERLVRYN